MTGTERLGPRGAGDGSGGGQAHGSRRFMSSYAEIGAAVIGSGFIGTVHIESLRRIGVPVTGLLQSSADRAAARAKELGVPRAYATLDELLADDDVRVVHVTSPNALHHPQVKQ